jgi:Flp pilus assembly pilin Flp
MVVNVLSKLQKLVSDEDGATAVEYAIMIVLIIVVAYVAVGFLGRETSQSFNKFVTTFNP